MQILLTIFPVQSRTLSINHRSSEFSATLFFFFFSSSPTVSLSLSTSCKGVERCRGSSQIRRCTVDAADVMKCNRSEVIWYVAEEGHKNTFTPSSRQDEESSFFLAEERKVRRQLQSFFIAALFIKGPDETMTEGRPASAWTGTNCRTETVS